jgi:transcriptional regulator with XRE-family HTH domain
MAIVDHADRAQSAQSPDHLRGARLGGSGPHTRIREFRKLRGMTLKQVADKLGTTPQTVQRLETANMTVSTYWLEKIARVLAIDTADLVSTRPNREIQIVGHIDERGRINRRENGVGTIFNLDVPADDPIAVRLDAAVGPFEAGMVLIANRLRHEDRDNAHGMDCLVATSEDAMFLRRIIRGRNGGWTLIPHQSSGEIQYDRQIIWVARILMAIKYF